MKTLNKFLTGSLLSLLCMNIHSQSLDEIVNKHIEAIGGRENWEKIKTLRSESILKAQGADIRITLVKVDKKAQREDINLMGMTGYSIIKNTEGWNYSPWQGHMKAEAMTADDIKNAQDGLYIQDDFLTYKVLEKKIEYYGTDDIEGVECFKIKMTGKDGKETTYYIDPENYLVIKTTTKLMSNGQEQEGSAFYSDYKKLDEGIVYPMSVAGGWGESETVKLDINPTIDESIFKPSK
jgi:hypothetical protein